MSNQNALVSIPFLFGILSLIFLSFCSIFNVSKNINKPLSQVKGVDQNYTFGHVPNINSVNELIYFIQYQMPTDSLLDNEEKALKTTIQLLQEEHKITFYLILHFFEIPYTQVTILFFFIFMLFLSIYTLTFHFPLKKVALYCLVCTVFIAFTNITLVIILKTSLYFISFNFDSWSNILLALLEYVLFRYVSFIYQETLFSISVDNAPKPSP